MRDKEIYRLAETCRVKREMQMVAGQWDIPLPSQSKKSLGSYMDELVIKRRKRDRIFKRVPFLKKYGGYDVPIVSVTENWFTDFQNYLLRDCKLAPASASSYSSAVRIALRNG